MELRDYLSILRVRKGIIILSTLVVAAAAVAVSLMQAPLYRSEARVLISEKDTSAALLGNLVPELSSQPERALQTQVQLMEVRPVAESTIKKLGLEMTPDALLDRVEVAGIGQTNVIAITVQASDPDDASLIANTMAEEYVDASRVRKRSAITEAADEVETRLKQAEEEILDIGRRIQASGKSEELTAELSMATSTYATLAEKLETLRINEQLESGSGSIVQPAVPQKDAVAPQPVRNGMLGLAVGLMLGLGMAFLYEYLDNTIKSTEEAEKAYGGPVLGTVPLDKHEKGMKRRLAILESPGSSTAEAYRVLRNSLDFINFEHKLKTLVITSAAPAEGKSTVAANLAAALSQAGKKVVLVSVDFRRPTTDQFFSVNNMIGLSDVLSGAHSLKSALQRPVDDTLLILTAGKMPPNPSELLGSEKMHEVIESLEEWADWVLIDSPPLLAVADPAAVARWADGVLMVSKAGESTKDIAHKATELLAKVGAKVIGVVAWGLEEGKAGYGYGYGKYAGGYYYYHSYYSDLPATKGSASQASDAWKAPEVSIGRKVAAGIGRVVTAVLAFLAVIALLLVVAYILDGYFGWGLRETVSEYISW